MNFLKVVRMALRYRWTFAAAVACALIVGALWGANIGALFPVVEVVTQGDSMQQWIGGQVTQAERILAEKSAQRTELAGQLARAAPARRAPLEKEIRKIDSRIAVEQKALRHYQFLRPYIEKYLPQNPFQTVVLIVGVVFLGTLLKDLFLVGNSILVARLAQSAAFDLRKLFFRRTLRMDLASFTQEGTSDLLSRFTNDMNQVASGLETLFGKMVREPLKMIACLVAAACISWRLLLLSMVVAPVAAWLIRRLAQVLRRANRRGMEEMAGIYATLEETFGNVKIVKAFTNERQARRRFHHNSKNFLKKAMKIAGFDALIHPVTEATGVLAITLAILAGVWLMLSKQTHLLGIPICDRPLDRTSILLFYGFLIAINDPLRKFSDVFSRLQAAEAACDRIFSRLEREPTVRNPQRPVPVGRHRKDLELDGVHFAYHPEKPVLQGIGLRIACGETIALVGPNGCGKSTLAHLIPRFADPTQGVIRLDGVALTDMRLHDLRDQIGLVTQETLLFDDTIFNNIRYGMPRADREAVIAAARQAHAHRFIETELSQGYETPAGTLGGRLSGGQRQRIALARAILRDPAILILDEPTSQVDLESEQAIQNVLEKFIRNRTTILITHRLSILALADRIAVMEAGRILDVGRHADLLTRCGLYRRLYQIQFDDLREAG
ncbi:MAG: ABC transporter ATP-binding protein [Pirellulales bacterium]|nr:ABC transporter ATP-binding protein [Pirellulales bacterium]